MSNDKNWEYTSFWYNKTAFNCHPKNYLYLTDGVDLKSRPLIHLINVPTPHSNGFVTQPDKTAFPLSEYFFYLLSLIPPVQMNNGVSLLANISGFNKSEVNVVKCLLMMIQKCKKITFYCECSDIITLMKSKFLKDINTEVIFVPDASRLKKYISTTQLPFEFGGTCYFNIFSWLKFMETFSAFEAYISKHFNQIMNAKERIHNQNLGTDRVWYLIPISTTFDSNIIEYCDKILAKFENSQNYFGLVDVARNPAFQMARDKINFYRSVLLKELNNLPDVQHLKIGEEINQSKIMQTSIKEDIPRNEIQKEIKSKKNLNNMANATKLIHLSNYDKKETELDCKLKILLQNPLDIKPPPTNYEFLLSNIKEENVVPVKKYVNETFQSKVYIEKSENFAQTPHLEPSNYSTDESLDNKRIAEHIDEINIWYSKALALFEEVDGIPLVKGSKIPTVVVDKVDDFCRKESLNLNSIKDVELIHGEVPLDWRILFYRVNCLQKILNNIRGLELEEIEEVMFWRKQSTLTKNKQIPIEPILTPNTKSSPLQEPQQSIKEKDSPPTPNNENFDDFMYSLNKLLSNEEVVEHKVSGREITMNDVDYDELIDLISKEFATHGPINRSTPSQQSVHLHSNVDSLKLESDRKNYEDDISSQLRPKGMLKQIEQMENIPTNRYLEDYDFTVDTFKGNPGDDVILKIPEFFNQDSGYGDFQHLSPPSYESFIGKSHFHIDSPRSVDSGIWTTSPI